MKTEDVINKFLDKDFGHKASNLYSKEGKLINYNTILAQWFGDTLLINITKYSTTTSKQQNSIVYGANMRDIDYYTVAKIDIDTTDLTKVYNNGL